MENQNQNPKQQLIARLKESNNVLVTVRRNPSVDQLSAAIGLTLLLNALGKHATAVFSGEIPNTLEFLKPEDTLEKTTDSLRDFIISLDKAKADKLRYKVEDKMVKIFITPYRTSLTEADLVFGQGDFNVDVVVALGVHEKEDLDEAITSHGRILHDATVAAVNTTENGQLGSINWVDTKASSLSEMVVPVCEALKPDSLDSQMATAFLTGIVAETQRFSNEKTSSDTMNISAKLMAAGANQQLVATQLEQQLAQPAAENKEMPVSDTIEHDGSLEIAHTDEHSASDDSLPEVQPDHQAEESKDESEDEQQDDEPSRLILEPPIMGGTLTANTKAEGLDPSTDPMTVKQVDAPLLSHDKDEEPVDVLAPLDSPAKPDDKPVPEPPKTEELPPENLVDEPFTLPPALPQTPNETTPPEQPPAEATIPDTQTLTDLETAVDSPHQDNSLDADAALAAAHRALDAVAPPEKPAAFNSTGLMEVEQPKVEDKPDLEVKPEAPEEEKPSEPAPIMIDPVTGNITYPSNLVPPSEGLPSDPTATSMSDPTAPPPVPPPMAMPPLMPPHEPPVDPNNLPPITP